MTTVKPVSVYLAGPIDHVTIEKAREWREEIAEEFGTVLFFSPAHAYFNARVSSAEAVVNVNKHVIACCDGLLANLRDQFSLGTIREIEFARSLSKPVAMSPRVPSSLAAGDLTQGDTLIEAMTGLLHEVMKVREIPKAMAVMLGLPEIFSDEDDQEA